MAELEDDLSASTARFAAFVQETEDEAPKPWHMRTSVSRIGLLAAIVIVVAVVVALIALSLVG